MAGPTPLGATPVPPGRVWPFLDHEGPLAFAHRGGASDAPENSLEAFAAAVDLGFRYLETDVHATADGHLVAFHDHRLDRVTDAEGRIADLPLDAVREARIAGRSPIPLLEDLLAALPEARVNIDPKHDAAVGPLCEIIERLGAVDRVCIGSFSGRRIATARRRLGPALCTGMGPGAVTRLRAAVAGTPVGTVPGVCAQVPVRVGPVPLVTERFVHRAHELGKVVHVWVVDDPEEMHRLLDLGVDGLMTDRPVVLRQVLETRGEW